MRMQRQIFYSFLLIIVIPTLSILIVILGISTRVIEERSISASELVVQESVKRVDTLLNDFRKASMQIYYNENVMALLDSGLSGFPGDPAMIREILGSMVNADKYLMSAVLRTGNRLIVQGTSFLGLQEYLDQLPAGADQDSGRISWIPSRRMRSVFGLDSYYFGAVRKIRKDNRELAELLFLVREEFFNDIYAGAIPRNTGRDLVLAPDGTVVSSPEEALIGTRSRDGRLLEILSGSRGKNGYLVAQGKGRTDYLIFARSEESGWYFIREMAEEEILAGIIRLRQSLVAIIGLFCLFLVFFSYLFSRGLSRPLKELAGYIDQIGQEDIRTPVHRSRLVGDEVLKLEDRLSVMRTRIGTLIREVSRKEQEKTRAELKALTNHISPHFIYNILDTIRWMAVINKQDNIRDMVMALDKLMRYAADSERLLIRLGEEMEIVREYVLIQRMRYSEIRLETEIPPGLENHLVNKFILQMLAENSIVHGFRDMDGTGIIRIQGAVEEGVLVLTVEDNGRWIEPEGPGTGEHAHTGLDSVNRRLNLHYGPGFTVTVHPLRGGGTRAVLRLPASE